MKTILISGSENLQLGNLFVARLIGRTAAKQQLPIAIGLFRSESYEGGYTLLLESIPAEVMRYINRKEVMVSTDRGPAVLTSFESCNPLNQVTQLLCQTHLEKNLKHHGWNFHIPHFERLRDATTEMLVVTRFSTSLIRRTVLIVLLSQYRCCIQTLPKAI